MFAGVGFISPQAVNFWCKPTRSNTRGYTAPKQCSWEHQGPMHPRVTCASTAGRGLSKQMTQRMSECIFPSRTETLSKTESGPRRIRRRSGGRFVITMSSFLFQVAIAQRHTWESTSGNQNAMNLEQGTGKRQLGGSHDSAALMVGEAAIHRTTWLGRPRRS